MKNNIPYTTAAFAQFPITPGEVEANWETFSRLLEDCPPHRGSAVVLPELWSGGFDYPQLEQTAAQTPVLLSRLQQLAASYDIHIAGSLPEVTEGKPYNTLFIVGADGVVGKLSKQFLFPALKEGDFFTPGRGLSPITAPAGVVGGMVCYDLRFPEIAREQAHAGATILLVPAQWPKVRVDHWRTLLQARAIENQVYIVAANGCGVSCGVELAGHSMIVAPDGSILQEADETSVVLSAPLEQDALEKARHYFCPPGEIPWRRPDEQKILSLPALKQKITAIRRQGSKVAFTNGCFDLLHAGHVSYLEKARSAGDCLVVGLNSDASVQRLKGPTRPVNDQEHRARVLAALGCVDFVVLFEDDTPIEPITELLPDVLVKGADWEEDQIVGAKEVKAAGGRVERIDFTYQSSTTQVIEKIRQ